ncbi:MAG TPA: RNA polymerase sigma factor SigJ [Jiangellaceae bacterium]
MSERTDWATAQYADHRELLFSIVYNIVGSVADTEDVLQETWLAWVAADHAELRNARGYLIRIAVNEAMNRLRKARRNRETYVGPWLPEPIVGDAAAERVVQAEAVSLAMLVVLETLTPLERAVFVLHEVFGYPHNEIATTIGRTPVAVRQLAHRAREHVRARRPRVAVDAEIRRAATEKFLAAALGGDVTSLLEILAPDVTLWADGGGKAPAARRVVAGRDKVVRLLTSPGFAQASTELTGRLGTVNGEPAVLLYSGDRLYAVGVLDLDADGRVRGLYGIANPDKLRHISRSLV